MRRFSLVLVSLLALLMVAFSCAALAQTTAAAEVVVKTDSEAVSWVKVIAENLLPLVFLILTPVLVLLARRLMKYLEEKWSFQMSAEQKASLDAAITGGVAYAEGKALAAVKTDPATIPSGAAKMDAALEFVMTEIKRLGLDELAAAKVRELLEAKLFGLRAAGIVPVTLKPASLPAVPQEWIDETLKKLGLPTKG